uniref:Uncharacterized protein n=1 Tax=viral metagenome TaxID=1070528 RepID=A0A6C0JZD7_9ZZZZ
MDKVKLNNILKTTVYSSLFIQGVTGLLDIYVYLIPVAGELAIIKKMLELEIFVQFIEGAFYVWFASIFSFVKNVTPNRYYDWAITTPTMLFTFCLYLDYLGEREKEKENLEPLLEKSDHTNDVSKRPSVKNSNLVDYFKQNWGVFLPIFFLNWMMLIFGYLGEIGELNNTLAVICGSLPFMTYFAIIYDKFAKYSSFYGKILYWIFFKIWALYGFAALGSYYWKNISYNILDLFAKNFFGIILAYTLYINI